MDFAVPAEHKLKFKESKKRDGYLDLARELKMVWNIKVTVIPIVIGALVTISKWLIEKQGNLETRGQIGTIPNNDNNNNNNNNNNILCLPNYLKRTYL